MIFAPVTEVKVYRNSAVVRRKATVSLTAGTNEIVLSGLSGTADPDSLRLFFPAGVVGTDVQILPYREAADSLPSEELEEEIAELQSSIDTLGTVEGLWIGNGNFETRGECSAETVESYLDALPAHLEKLRARRKELVKQLEELRDKQEELKKKEAFQAVKLVLEAPEDGEVPCEIEYTERSARWNSTYEIHTSADSGEISVVSRARITQSSGEDWENVSVSLYTGNPTARQEIPILKKLLLDFLPEKKETDGLAAVPMAAASAPAPGFMAMGMGMQAPMMKMAMPQAAEEDADTMTCYSLPGKRTVASSPVQPAPVPGLPNTAQLAPGNNIGTMADLKTDTIPADMRIICVPSLDNSAYLAAMIKTADWPLKPSAAKIYLNENYCGELYVAPDMTEDVFTLSLGRDERVSVSRETIRSKTEDVLLKGQKRKYSEFAVRVSNNRDNPLNVIVWDQIPVSAEKQIVVDRVEHDGASLNEETGKLNWNLTVPGKSTVEKRLSYSVAYPKEKLLRETRTNAKSGLKPCPRCGAFASGKFCPECGSVVE